MNLKLQQIKAINLMCISIIIIFLFCLVGCSTDYPITEKTFKLKQMTIDMQNGIQGEFVLGCGGINTESHFIFYMVKDGAVVFRKINVKICKIYEDVEDIEESYCKAIWDNKEAYNCGYPTSRYARWEFHIPKNSIYNSINMDLK